MSFRNTTRVSNSLDPDQDRRSVGPDLGQKLFAKFISRRQKSPLARKELIKIIFRLNVDSPPFTYFPYGEIFNICYCNFSPF